MANSPDRGTARSFTTFRGVEPVSRADLSWRFVDQSSTRPPGSDGDADGRSIVLLDEMDASAEVLDLDGCYVIPAPLDCRRRHDGAWVEGRAPAMSMIRPDLSDDPTSWPETYLRWLYRVAHFRPAGSPRWQPAGSADGCWP